MSFEEPLGLPQRPPKNRQEPKVALPESFPEQGGMAELAKHYDVEFDGVDSAPAKRKEDSGSDQLETVEKPPGQADTIKAIDPKADFPGVPGLIEEENHDAYYLKRVQEFSPLNKDKSQSDAIQFPRRETPIPRKISTAEYVNPRYKPGPLNAAEDSEPEVTEYFGRTMTPPIGFYQTDHVQKPKKPTESASDHDVDLSEFHASVGVESGVREKSSQSSPIEITGAASDRNAKIPVSGDRAQAPFKPSQLEKDDADEHAA